MSLRETRSFVYTVFPAAFWTVVVLHSACARLFMDNLNRNMFFASEFREIATFALPAVFAVNWRNFRMDKNAVFEAWRKKRFPIFRLAFLAIGSFCSFLACLSVPLSVFVSADNPKSGWTGWLVSLFVSQDLSETKHCLGIACLTLNVAADSIRLLGTASTAPTSIGS